MAVFVHLGDIIRGLCVLAMVIIVAWLWVKYKRLVGRAERAEYFAQHGHYPQSWFDRLLRRKPMK